MAGHNKWSQIKHKKAKNDSSRGKAFTKLIKEITIAARSGGGDPAGNPRLRLLIEKAREINMPLDNTQRAIKRGTGELPGVNYEAFTYEGYGPNNIAIMVDTLSDNKNRTVAEFRRLFSSNGGALGENGSVGWMFERQGVIRVSGNTTEDELLEKLIEHDIKDIQKDESLFTIYADVKQLYHIKQLIADAGLKVESAEIEWVASTVVDLTEEQSTKVYEFLEALEDHEDVQNVYSNVG